MQQKVDKGFKSTSKVSLMYLDSKLQQAPTHCNATGLIDVFLGSDASMHEFYV